MGREYPYSSLVAHHSLLLRRMQGDKRDKRARGQGSRHTALPSSQVSDAASQSSTTAATAETASQPGSSVARPPEYLIVGQVVGPFGITGEMKVNILTEFPERLAEASEVVLTPFSSISLDDTSPRSLDPAGSQREPTRTRTRLQPGGAQQHGPPKAPTTFQVAGTRLHKGQLLLRLAGVGSADAAETLRGCWVVVPLEKAKKLPRGAYYLYQIVGLEVYDTARRYIGKIAEVLTLAANDVYVVRGPGVTEATGELLVPAIKPVVKRMELKRGRIVIVPPEDWS